MDGAVGARQTLAEDLEDPDTSLQDGAAGCREEAIDGSILNFLARQAGGMLTKPQIPEGLPSWITWPYAHRGALV